MYLHCRSLCIIHSCVLLKIERKREGRLNKWITKYEQGRIKKKTQFVTSYDKNQIDFLCCGRWITVELCYRGLFIDYMGISML